MGEGVVEVMDTLSIGRWVLLTLVSRSIYDINKDENSQVYAF